jgi:tetratricopeptide (TPR) repeat protein
MFGATVGRVCSLSGWIFARSPDDLPRGKSIMNEIVCQVSNREGQVEFIWSSHGGYFRPYTITGGQLGELREAAQSVRKALGEVVYAQNQAGDGPLPGEPAYALAEAGFRLYNYLLPSEDETARKVRKWLDELRKEPSLDALEIVLEERSADPRAYLSVPWNLVYDERPAKHKPAFQAGKSTERWRPFWSIRYNLTSGRRVEPLKRLPTWIDPRVLVVVDPEVYSHLNDNWREALDAFLAEKGLTMITSMEELEVALEEGYPRLLYWLGHANPDYLQLGPNRIAPGDLRNLLRSFDDRERPEGMLAFLNCCQTAEAGQVGSFLDVLHSFGFTGAIATEQQTIDNFACEIGLAFLKGFLNEGRPLGELLHGLRLSMAPLGLLYGAHCPPEIHVKLAGASTGAAQPAITEHGRAEGIILKVAARRMVAGGVVQPAELPARPYRSLGYFDRADRALFTGRDADIVRFAATLDRSDTRILILHGESGLGKSSFLRAGVIPYLEEQCVGYRFLRRQDDSVQIIPMTKDAVGQIAQALLDATARPLEYPTPEGDSITIDLRQPIDELLGAPADYASLRAAMTRDTAFLKDLLTRLAARLPHALILVIDQAEELFTLARTPDEIEARDRALKMLQRTVDIRADVKLIVSLRTEYYGRLLDHLRAGRQDLTGVRDDLLRDFSQEALIAAIERPTSELPIAEGQPSPREKYGFRFAEGVAAQIAQDGLELRTEHQDSVLPLIQVICTQLYERTKARPDSDGIIRREDLEAIRGVEGGLKAFAEEALEWSLELSAADQSAFKALFARLYSRQPDGTLTTWLAPRDALESSWYGSKPFAQVLEAAVAVRLLREDALRVEGTEPRPFIRLGHDALAKVAAAWQKEREEEERVEQERAAMELERKKRREQIRKMAVGVAVAAGLALLFGVTALWANQNRRRAVASEQQAKASEQQAVASEQQAVASEQLALARKTEAQDSLKVACQGLDDLLTQVADVDLADIPQMEQVRRLLLEKAQGGYQNLLLKSESGDQTELRWLTARAYGRLGEIEEMLGDYQQSESSFRQAIALLNELSAGSPLDVTYGRDLVRAHVGLATLHKELYRFPDALAELKAAEAVRQQLHGQWQPQDDKLLAGIDYQMGVVLALQQKLRGGPTTQSPGAGGEIEQAYQRAIQVQEKLVHDDQGQTERLARLGRYLNNLGLLLAAAYRTEDAEKTFRRVIETVPDSEKLPGQRWQNARASYNLGTSIFEEDRGLGADIQGTRAKALALIQPAMEKLDFLHAGFPGVPQYQAELAFVLASLGRIEQGEEGRAKLERSRALSRTLVDRFPNVARYKLLLAEACGNLSDHLCRTDPAKAKAFADEAIQVLKGPADARDGVIPEYVGVSLGTAYLQLSSAQNGEPKRALVAVEQAIKYHKLALESYPESNRYQRNLWDDYSRYADLLIGLDDLDRAADAAEELPRIDPRRAKSYPQAAMYLTRCAQRSKDKGPDYGRRAVEVLRKAVQNNRAPSRKMLENDVFKPLRNREDFQRLLESLAPPRAA